MNPTRPPASSTVQNPPPADGPSKSRLFRYFVLPVLGGYAIWGIYMLVSHGWRLFMDYFYMSITMVFGSFVAGASSEGGGAVAFPVMTLLFKIHPADARNFSLAIQSVGMTAAALWIIARKIKIEMTYLRLGSIGATAGILFGTYLIVPHTAPAYAKMLFVSFWLSFGLTLYVVNRRKNRNVFDQLPSLNRRQEAELIGIGFIGGILSSILGSGVDICTFSFATMKYHLSEKVATPTSVVLMAINAVTGFLLHQWLLGDINPVVYNYWLVCIPVCLLGAPLGAFVVSKAKRLHIVHFLCAIILIQFIGAMLIIRPGGALLAFSIASFVAGLVIFFWLTKRSGKNMALPVASTT